MKTGTTSIFKSIFQDLDERALDTLRSLAQLKTYEPQTILCHQGEIEHTFYVVVEGRVAITQRLEDGQERLLSIVGPREYFGELALLDDTPRMADCITITTVTVLEITEDVFQSVLESSPPVAYSLMRHVVQLLRSNDRLALLDLMDKNEQLRVAYEELQAAQAEIVEKERLERELEIAANLQRTLLPDSLPTLSGYRLAAYLKPARQVGGDFYDAFKLDGNHIGLLLADVADKSVQAALFMAVARTLFMVESRRSLAPADVMHEVHRSVIRVAPSADIFVTAFYGVLNRSTRVLRYAQAGHEKPLVIRRAGGIEELAGKGRFLGMLEPLQLDEYTVQLNLGDRLVLFSDGVPDASQPNGNQFGYVRLRDYLEQSRELTLDEMVDGLAAEIGSWTGDAPAFDDLTLLALEVKDDLGPVQQSA